MSEEPNKTLPEFLATVHTSFLSMKRCLDQDQLMDGLKSASTMLAELRTSVLSPKQYYELYMAVFDALRHLSAYLYDAHTSGKHHLADLYELVQYAGNIIPRLYLMITVGTVYMSVSEAPVKEIMKDMMEMARGVQHPTRGLFLRHYLSGMTRDHLPLGEPNESHGGLQDSIAFVLTNFIEVNKLWVRLQHQGLSRDRERRESERKELRILVGTNLVRLSQLEGVDFGMYSRVILPSVLEQIVSCKDVIAQEYLMEVIVQVFPDEFHLRTLAPYLTAVSQLQPRVNIKQLVITLIDRLTTFAAREAENEATEERERHKLAIADRIARQIAQRRYRPNQEQNDGLNEHQAPSTVHSSLSQNQQSTSTQLQTYAGIPDDLPLFEVFWREVTDLIQVRADLGILDLLGLLTSLLNLSLTCYPDRLDYVDQVLGNAHARLIDSRHAADMHHLATIQTQLALLLAPIDAFSSMLTLLALPSFGLLLSIQSTGNRKIVARAIIASLLKNDTRLQVSEDVIGVLSMIEVVVVDGRHSQTSILGTAIGEPNSYQSVANSDLAEEQGWVARLIHLIQSDNPAMQFELLSLAKSTFVKGAFRMRWTYPPLIIAAIRLARTHALVDLDSLDEMTQLFKFIHQAILELYNSPFEAAELCLRLVILSLQAADEAGLEELAYEFAVQAFEIYDESINTSKSQQQAISLIIQTLQQSRIFSVENYDVLITKCAITCTKLLKKFNQAAGIGLASHLWYQTEVSGGQARPGKYLLQDGKRILECLQKQLRIATSCFDRVSTLQIYISVLDQYLYYFERQMDAVPHKHVNSLIELINTQIDAALDLTESQISTAYSRSKESKEPFEVAQNLVQHFKSTLLYIQHRQNGLSSDQRDLEESKESSIDMIGEEHKILNSHMNLYKDIDITGPLLRLGLVN